MKATQVFQGANRRTARFLSIVLTFGVLGIPTLATPEKASAALSTCAVGSAAQNSIAVEPSHPTVMYIDSGVNPRVDASYVGYRISNRTGATMKGYWASLDNFTGGVISLANPLDKYIALPEIAANETKTVYFLLKATTSTKTQQTHDFKVWDEYPGASTAQNKYGCNFGFTKVSETIKALANKPTSTTVSTIGAIGTTFTVTSVGASGTIGAGNPDVGRILWFTPAAYSNFPTRAFRLESVVLKVGTKNSFATNGGDSVRFYKERTFIKTDTTPDLDSSFTG